MKAVIYLRVSTKEQADKDLTAEGFSIPAQREACTKFIADQGWELDAEFVDKGESARSADRPELRAMLEHVARRPDVDVVVVHKIDRLARNLEDHVAIRAHLRRYSIALASVSEKVEDSASGKMVEGIHALMAEFYSANLSAEIKKGLGQKAKMGGYPRCAPLGYLNVRETIGGRPVARIVPDSERAHLVAQAFELYATGQFTIATLAEEMGQRGLTNRGRSDYPSKALTVSGLAAMLANKTYLGIVSWGGVDYVGTHEPLVTPGVFEKVTELLAARSPAGTRQRKHSHYLKGLLHCGVCGRRLSLQRSKGIYTYFYCLGQKDRRNPTGCRESYLSADVLEECVEHLYGTIQIPESWAAGLSDAVANEVSSRSASTEAEAKSLSSKRQRLEAERLKLMSAYYAGAIDIDLLKVEQDRIGRELLQVAARQKDLDTRLDDWQDVMNRAVSFATNCSGTYRKAGARARKAFNAAVFHKVLVRDGRIADAEFRVPFDLLFHEPKFEYETVVEVSGLEPPTPTLRTSPEQLREQGNSKNFLVEAHFMCRW